MSADGFVQVAPDSTGKKIDNTEVTRNDGTIVERQRVVLADPDRLDAFVRITHAGEAPVRVDRYFELSAIAALDAQAMAGITRKERFSPTDRRGSNGRGSTR